MDNRFTDYYRLGGIAGLKTGKRHFENDIQRSLCVNPSRKLIYYKPGKAAGTSIFRMTLQPMGGWIIQKDNPKEFSQWIETTTDDEMDKYFSFIFVRNPFSRLVSYWNDTERSSQDGSSEFRQFVKRKDNIFKDGVPTALHYQTQSSLVEIPDATKSNLNFVGKVENIDEDWSKLCSTVGIPHKKIGRHKSRTYEHCTSLYDDESKKIVTDMYQRDLDVFNYKFGE